jgi:hypothetical protein
MESNGGVVVSDGDYQIHKGIMSLLHFEQEYPEAVEDKKLGNIR